MLKFFDGILSVNLSLDNLHMCFLGHFTYMLSITTKFNIIVWFYTLLQSRKHILYALQDNFL